MFLDRDREQFGYVLDYLRNGGKLPPLMPTDEEELELVRREFDYFCIFPNPVGKTWVEKLRDREYTLEFFRPEEYYEDDFVKARRSRGGLLSDEGNLFIAHYDCDVELARRNKKCVSGILQVWELECDEKEYLEHYVIARHDLRVREFGGTGDVIMAVSTKGHEVAYMTSGSLRIVGMRKEVSEGNLVQEIIDPERTNRLRMSWVCSRLSDSHLVVHNFETACVWERLTGNVVRELNAESGDTVQSCHFAGGNTLVARWCSDTFTVYDLSQNGAPAVQRMGPWHYTFSKLEGNVLYYVKRESADDDEGEEQSYKCGKLDVFTGETLTERSFVCGDFNGDDIHYTTAGMLCWTDEDGEDEVAPVERIHTLNIGTGVVQSVRVQLAEVSPDIHLVSGPKPDYCRLVCLRGDDTIAVYTVD